MDMIKIIIGLTLLFAFFIAVYDRYSGKRIHTEDVHVDLYLTQKQIDNQETVDIHVPGSDAVNIVLPPIVKDGYTLRMQDVGGNGYTLLVHIHVDQKEAEDN